MYLTITCTSLMQGHVYAAMKQVDDVIDLKVRKEGVGLEGVSVY